MLTDFTMINAAQARPAPAGAQRTPANNNAQPPPLMDVPPGLSQAVPQPTGGDQCCVVLKNLVAGIVCMVCGEGNLDGDVPECAQQTAVDCGAQYPADANVFCFTRHTLLTNRKSAVEKLCVTDVALIQEYGEAVAIDGCDTAWQEQVHYCTCRTNMCNEQPIGQQMATLGMVNRASTSQPAGAPFSSIAPTMNNSQAINNNVPTQPRSGQQQSPQQNVEWSAVPTSLLPNPQRPVNNTGVSLNNLPYRAEPPVDSRSVAEVPVAPAINQNKLSPENYSSSQSVPTGPNDPNVRDRATLIYAADEHVAAHPHVPCLRRIGSDGGERLRTHLRVRLR